MAANNDAADSADDTTRLANARRRDAAALVFAMIYPTVMAWIYFVGLANRSEAQGSEANPAMQMAYSMGKLAQFIFPVVYLGVFDRGALRMKRPHLRGLLGAVLFGLAVAAGIVLLYDFLLRDLLNSIGTPERVRAKVTEFNAATPLGYLMLATFIAVAHSLLEEYYWRWFVFRRLSRHSSLALAIALSSLAFMAHHVVVLYVYLPGQFLTAAVPFSLCIAVGGAVWAWMYHRDGSIVSVWISHFFVDAGILFVGYRLIFG